MSGNSNSTDKRLVRIETRLTNFGRYFGIDLTKRPPANAPDQPVFIDNGVVYATPTAAVGDIMVAVYRHKGWSAADTEVPIVINQKTIATIDAWELTRKEQWDGEDCS